MIDEIFNLSTEPIKFEETIKYFKGKLTLSPAQFYKLSNEYKTLAFTVSGYSKAQVLNKFQSEIAKALESGETIKSFKKSMNEFLEKEGYKGITDFQADNIFRTNIQTAYNVGHYMQMTDKAVLKLRPYWQYSAVGDARTRLAHKAMDQKVFPADSPIWDTWYPPNGFRCRCGVRSLSKEEVKARGLAVETEIPKAVEVEGKVIQVIPDRNFHTNPAKEVFKPNFEGYPASIKKAYEKRKIENK